MSHNVQALMNAVVDAAFAHKHLAILGELLTDASPDNLEKMADQVRPINADLASAISYVACAIRPWHVTSSLIGLERAGDVPSYNHDADRAVEMFKRLGVECKLV